MLNIVTDLGDSALLLPGAIALLAYLWTKRSPRKAVALAAGLAFCVVVTIVLKLGFHACGNQVPLLDIRSPSGHAALSATLYGSCALLLAEGRERGARLAIALGAILLVLAIAISRVLLDAHTVAEVVVGLLIGASSVAFFRAWSAGLPEVGLNLRLVLGGLVMLAVLTHGRHLDAEEMIIGVAREIRGDVGICEAQLTRFAPSALIRRALLRPPA
jgi:PAP2 superfamily